MTNLSIILFCLIVFNIIIIKFCCNNIIIIKILKCFLILFILISIIIIIPTIKIHQKKYNSPVDAIKWYMLHNYNTHKSFFYEINLDTDIPNEDYIVLMQPVNNDENDIYIIKHYTKSSTLEYINVKLENGKYYAYLTTDGI